jgi:abortive infection bacteriophage resistance protein
MLKDIDQSAKRSREVFVKDYFAKYTSEPGLPLWMAAEVASFGNLFTFFRHIHYQEQKFLASQLAISAKVLENWLMCLNYVRNLCAHHSRLWNLELAIKPIVPDNDPDWLSPVPLDNRWTYAALTVLRWLLRKIAPDSLWKDRLKELLLEYPDIPVSHAGFPDAWETSPIWK